jgi:hypothetical protein
MASRIVASAYCSASWAWQTSFSVLRDAFHYRYFFYITNDRVTAAHELVLAANQRCDQENLIEQLKNGVKAMKLPVDTLISNWA